MPGFPSINTFRILLSLSTTLCFYSFLFSQTTSKNKLRDNYVKDSIRIFTPKKIYPQLALDNRKSFIRNSPVDIQGIYTGILYKSRFKFGTGYYQVDAKGHSNTNIRGMETEGLRDLDLYYGTLNFEYLLIDRRFIKFGFPINLGIGFSNLNIYDNKKSKLLYHSVGNFIPFSLGSEFTLKPLREIGLTTSLGYRKILIRSEPRIDFDGLYYSYGLVVDVKEIIKDIRWFQAKKRYKKALRLK